MQALYETAWGWDDAAKRAELAAAEARYIIVYTQVVGRPGSTARLLRRSDEGLLWPTLVLRSLAAARVRQS